MTILVLGGAGYIGSHMVSQLYNQGNACVVLDNLSTGFREALVDVPFYQGDIADKSLLRKLFQQHDITTVMHFAASLRDDNASFAWSSVRS